jgi:hypothetical protein
LDGVTLLVAQDQLELAAAQHAALRVDLVDGHREAALDRLARQRGAAGQRGHERDDDGGLGLGERGDDAPHDEHGRQQETEECAANHSAS